MTTDTRPEPTQQDPDAWYLHGRTLSRTEAADALGVSVSTVSKQARAGLIRRRKGRYCAEDVERLVQQANRRRRADVRQDGAAIKRYRKRRGWSQLDLAVEADVQTDTIRAAEYDRRSTHPSILRRIAKALGVGVGQISRKR